jgi:hypothetical protein
MKNSKFKIQNLYIIFVLHFAMCICFAQSNEQKFPTAVTTNQINGKIAAKDIGDSRLTTYFYTFNGTQGDIFLTIETNNLNGDIDIFTADELRPITKIAVFADSSDRQTVRTIYLRKDEKLILRIEGKTPNDDDATYKIKFEGSFIAANDTKKDEVEAPKVKSKTDSDVVVNSVGTIIEVKPKPTPTPTVEIAKIEKPKTPKVKPAPKPKVEKTPKVKPTEETAKTEENKESTETPATPKPSVKPPKVKKPKVETAENLPQPEKTKTPKPEKPKKTPKPKAEPKPNSSAALEGIKLLVELKDGTKFERPMSEVLRVNVDKEGILTIVTKDGKIERYSILDVAKMTIQ